MDRNDSQTEGAGSLNQPAAYQKAPTLMAAEVAGSQGAVQVWAPDEALLKKRVRHAWTSLACAIGSPFLIVPFVCMGGWIPQRLFSFCVFIVGMLPGLAVSVVPTNLLTALTAKKRPRYLTTDDAGIGITTITASRYLRWDEIYSARRMCGTLFLSTLHDPRVEILLSGYVREKEDALWALIAAKSGLEPRRQWRPFASRDWLRLRPGYKISPLTGIVTRESPSLPSSAVSSSLPDRTAR